MKSILILPILFASLLASSSQGLTIDDLIAKAIERSPDLNVSRAAVEAARQNIRIRRSNYLPQLNLSASAGAAGAKSNAAGVKTDTNGQLLTGSLTASQLVYDFGKTRSGIRAASFDANASVAAFNQAVLDKIFEVKKAYYGMLRAKSLIAVNEENVKLNEKQLYRAQRYFESGIRTKIDVTDARVNLIRARLDLQDARYDLQRARIELERVVGFSLYDGNYTIASVNQERSSLTVSDFNGTDVYATLPAVDQPLADLESFAYTHRPELRKYTFNQESAREEITKAKGDYFPAIGLEGSYSHSATDDALEFYFPEQQWFAGIGVKWNLFEGMRTDAAVAYARAQLMQSKAAEADAKLRIRQEVADTYTLTLKSRDSVKLSQSLAEAAKEKFVQAQKRYEYGLSDFIELQQARQGYIDAGANLVVQYFDFFIALAQRDRAMGK